MFPPFFGTIGTIVGLIVFVGALSQGQPVGTALIAGVVAAAVVSIAMSIFGFLISLLLMLLAGIASFFQRWPWVVAVIGLGVVILLVKATAVGRIPTAGPQTTINAPPTSIKGPTPASIPGAALSRPGCDPAYPDARTCLPPGPPFNQGCAITAERRFTVLPPDPQGLDHDGDGIGCEPVASAPPPE